MTLKKILMKNDSALPFIEKKRTFIPNVHNLLWEELKRYFVVNGSPEKTTVYPIQNRL
jgi:hypothetical protein